MSNLGVMKTRIVDDMVRDDLTSNQLVNAINDAIELQEGERFKFNEKRYTLLTVAGQEYYDLSEPTLLASDGSALGTGELLLEVDGIFITVNNSTLRLTARTQEVMDERQITQQGQPCEYSFYGQQLRLGPIPDAVYTLNPRGLARLSPNPLSADADTNAWMTDGERLIRSQAKGLIYRDILRDREGVELAATQYAEAVGALKRKMAAQAYIGTMKAWDL